jgi:hypothetical protein
MGFILEMMVQYIYINKHIPHQQNVEQKLYGHLNRWP